MKEIITARDVEIVTAEIITIKRQTQQVLVTAAIEIGRRLTEAKAMMPHGEWGKYLEERVEYSQSTAINLMRIYQEYGSEQESLFENFANSQTFANLNYSQALALLSVPAEDRAQFAEENDVANKSTREIQELIRQRDEKEKQLEQLRSELDGTEEAMAAAKDEKDEAVQKQNDLQHRLDEVTRKAAEKEKEKKQLEDELHKALQAEEHTKQLLKEAKENPVISDDAMEKIRKEAEESAAKAAAERAVKEVEEIKEKLGKAQEAEASAKKQLEDVQQKLTTAQKETKLANPNVAVFKTLFEQIQQTFQNMNDCRKLIAETDSEMAENLKNATLAVLEQWKGALR